MKVLLKILMAAALLPIAAQAREWHATYTNTESGFKHRFSRGTGGTESTTKDQFGGLRH